MLEPIASFVTRRAISLESLARDVPAAFASEAHERRSKRYSFISTAAVLAALREAGFEAADGRQMQVRGGGPASHAKHMIRLTHVRESLTLVDTVPEIVLINSHDGTSAYTLRAGLYRPLCTNGLITEIGDFGLIHVPHRGDVAGNVVAGAIAITQRFAEIGAVVEQMHRTMLDDAQRQHFAAQALKIRYPKAGQHIPIATEQVLQPRRWVDQGQSLWLTYNVVQESLMRGGIQGYTATRRATQTRSIRAIREDVRINTELWRLALAMLHAG